jgi:hypothetical protein
MSAPDQRVVLAREYLADVSRTGVDQLPPTVLAREVAELRRQLGQVLAVLAERQPEVRQQAAIAGPFATDREAHAAALQLGGPARPGWSILSEAQNRAMLADVCEQAGIGLGAYDERILSWLAGWEDATCAVIAGLIARARAGGAMIGGVDSESWTCLGCGGQMIGRRPADDRCRDCAPGGAR